MALYLYTHQHKYLHSMHPTIYIREYVDTDLSESLHLLEAVVLRKHTSRIW